MLNLIKRSLRAVGLMKPERRVYEFKNPSNEGLEAALRRAKIAAEAMKPGPPSVFSE